MINLYLIRHTTPDINADICYGQTDIALPATHPAEFAAVVQKLADIHAPICYTSPLQRCRLLADHLSTQLHWAPPVTDARLMELNFGDWEMQAWNTVPRGLLDAWADEHIRHAPPKGESFLQLQQRAIAFATETLTHQSTDNTVVIITHAGVIRALVSHFIGLPLAQAFSLGVDYGNITCLQIEKTWAKLHYLNR